MLWMCSIGRVSCRQYRGIPCVIAELLVIRNPVELVYHWDYMMAGSPFPCDSEAFWWMCRKGGAIHT